METLIKIMTFKKIGGLVVLGIGITAVLGVGAYFLIQIAIDHHRDRRIVKKKKEQKKNEKLED